MPQRKRKFEIDIVKSKILVPVWSRYSNAGEANLHLSIPSQNLENTIIISCIVVFVHKFSTSLLIYIKAWPNPMWNLSVSLCFFFVISIVVFQRRFRFRFSFGTPTCLELYQIRTWRGFFGFMKSMIKSVISFL